MTKASNSDKDVLTTARVRLSRAVTAYSQSRQDELEDLKFAAGSPDNQWQWPSDVIGVRGAAPGQAIGARPCLTVNKLPQHIRQVTNDQRQNRPSGKVIPADDKADIEIAEIFDGMLRHIEYMSDADVAYDTACENQVTFGEGYFRVLTEYCDDDTFNQDIRIGRIRNSFSVYLDPTIQDPCGSDAEWGFIIEDVLIDEYDRLYPNATPVSSLQSQHSGDQTIGQWIGEKAIKVAEYFYVEYSQKTLNLYPGNLTAISGSTQEKQITASGMRPLKTRRVDVRQVKWIKTNGYEILESRDWAGKWIPIIRVVGNEFEVEGEVHVSGIVRNAKDAQRMYNYWCSQEAEMLALAPKAPFIGYGGQFEGYERQWKTANTTNWPYLEVNPDVTDGNGAVLPLPQRALPPMAQTGLIQAKMGASDDIKAVTGQYDSSLGQTSNERSGKAILARERQTDTGTYHYVDNLARAIRHCARQIIDLIPKIYDTDRIARIVGEDGETKMVKLNPGQPEAVKQITDPSNQNVVMEKIYNPSVGKYDICITTGPSYMTKRQEALDGMGEALKNNPELWKIAGDLFVKNMDWPGALELAKRLQKTIDPKLLSEEDESPALQAANQQIEAMGHEMEQMHQMLQNVSKSIEVQEQRRADYEAKIRAYDAETKRISALAGGLTPDNIHDMIMGTLHAAIASGDIAGQLRQFEGVEELPEHEPDQSMVQPDNQPVNV